MRSGFVRGWIQAPVSFASILEERGIRIGKYCLTDRRFENCHVPLEIVPWLCSQSFVIGMELT